jgi:hypothetical protein
MIAARAPPVGGGFEATHIWSFPRVRLGGRNLSFQPFVQLNRSAARSFFIRSRSFDGIGPLKTQKADHALDRNGKRKTIFPGSPALKLFLEIFERFKLETVFPHVVSTVLVRR